MDGGALRPPVKPRAPMSDRCAGPDCSRLIDADSPSPDFCGNTCRVAWEIVDHPTDEPVDGGKGPRVTGADYGPGYQARNRGGNTVGYAFGWLDVRREAG